VCRHSITMGINFVHQAKSDPLAKGYVSPDRRPWRNNQTPTMLDSETWTNHCSPGEVQASPVCSTMVQDLE
jgi:hypothetical protein